MLVDAILVTVVLFAAICLSILLAFTVFGPRTIHHYGHDLRWVACKHCTAGTQWWDGDNWGPIPQHARRVQDGVFTIEPAQANVRKCLHCGTKGGHWVDRNGPQKLRNPDWRTVPKGPGEDKLPDRTNFESPDPGQGAEAK